MIPQQYTNLAQIISEERIAAAVRRRPEWDYPLASRPEQRSVEWSRIIAQVAHRPALLFLRIASHQA
jgi:hypothetical protein